MSKKKTRGLLQLIATIPTLFSFFNNIGDVISYEALEAKRSLKKMIIIRFLLAPLLTASWLCFLSILYLFMTSWQLSPILSLSIILLLNIIILAILAMIFLRAKRNLSFPATRSFVKDLLRLR